MVEIVESGDEDTRRLHEVETRLWSLLLALGRSPIALYLSRRASRIASEFYEHDKARYFVSKREQRSSKLGTIFGNVLFTRPVGRPLSNGRGASDLFVDRALGVVSGFSLMVVLHLTRLSAQMPFARARETFRNFEVAYDRPKTKEVDAKGGLLEVMFYGDANPVKAGMVSHPSRYRFSAYAYYAYGRKNRFTEKRTPPPEYLALGNSPEERQRRYRERCDAYLSDRNTSQTTRRAPALFRPASDFADGFTIGMTDIDDRHDRYQRSL